MPIKRSTDQKSVTLAEFYERARDSDDAVASEIGKAMLEWIAAIDQQFPNRLIWGVTSLYRLQLHHVEHYTSDIYTSIIATKGEYHIEFNNQEKQKTIINSLSKAMAILEEILENT
ncbi:MAG: hypothetical protein AB8F95_14040 [Bacteroidia bacterium]